MIWIHLYDWWVIDYDQWVFNDIKLFMVIIFAPSFLFISGISTFLWYKNKLLNVPNLDKHSLNMIRREYMFRTLIIFIIAIIYNSFTAIRLHDISWIWTWFMLLTISISLFLAWPLLKCSKFFRLVIAISVWIINQIILRFLSIYEGESNIYGILFHLLYNSLDFDPILIFFPYFLFGTVIGDIIFDVYLIDNFTERRLAFKNKILIPISILGVILIFSNLYPLVPLNSIDNPFPWIVFALGINLLILTVLLAIEEFEIFKTEKRYTFFFYFSYYSLTIYLSHNILYFFFNNTMNPIVYSIIIIGIFGIFQFLLREVYKKYGYKASLKIQINRISVGLANIIRKKRISY